VARLTRCALIAVTSLVGLTTAVAAVAAATSAVAAAAPSRSSVARTSGPASGQIYIADQVGCGFSVEGFGADWGFVPNYTEGLPADDRFGWTCGGSIAGHFLPAGPVVFTALTCVFDGRGPFNPPLRSGVLTSAGTLIIYRNETFRAICPPAERS
jgi:hypothetical protein